MDDLGEAPPAEGWPYYVNTEELWRVYGNYANRRVVDGEMPLRFEDWLIEEQRLAGKQQDLF